MDRKDPKAAPGEDRGTLEAWLDDEREGVAVKAQGVSDVDGAISAIGSGTSVRGVAQHVALVEDSWFGVGLRTGAGLLSDAAFAPTSSVGNAVAAHAAACSRSRSAHEGIDLVREMSVGSTGQ